MESSRVFQLSGKWYAWLSDHPLEERVIELTEDYRDTEGNLIVPEALAWDGVQTCPGLVISVPDEES